MRTAMNTALRFLCVIALALMGVAPASGAVPGDADSSFGADGLVTTAIGRESSVQAIALQPDGKIVAAGYTVDDEGRKFAVARYLQDGSLDSSFAGDGVVVTAVGAKVGGLYAGEGRDIALDADGKLVVAGYAEGTVGEGGKPALVRYLPDGGLDPDFGDGGVVVTALERPLNVGRVLVEPGGRIVVAGGWSYELGDASDVCEGVLLGYRSEGDPDGAFGSSGGRWVAGLPECFIAPDVSVPPRPHSFGLAQQAGGRIIAGFSAATLSPRPGVLYGLTPDGRPDGGFGDGGQRDQLDVVPGCPSASLALAPSGDIYLLAVCPLYIEGEALSRFSADGALRWSSLGTPGWPNSDVAVEPSGRPLIVDDGGNWRMSADGRLDLSYGPCGLAGAVPGWFGGNVGDADVQPDGRAVVAGSLGEFGSGFAVARYLGGERPPAVRGAARVSAVAATSANVELRTTLECGPSVLSFDYGPRGGDVFQLAVGPGVGDPVRNLYRSRLSGLRPDTLYEYSVRVRDHFNGDPHLSGWQENTDDGVFTTLPLAVTGVARRIRSRSALLTGTVQGGGGPLATHFEYGRRLLRQRPTRVLTPTGKTTLMSRLRELRPSTRYRYRLVAVGRRRGVGSLRSFVTLPSLRLRLARDLGAAWLRVTEPGRARVLVLLARRKAHRLGIPRLLAHGATTIRHAGLRRVALTVTPAGRFASSRGSSTVVRIRFRTRRGKLVTFKRGRRTRASRARVVNRSGAAADIGCRCSLCGATESFLRGFSGQAPTTGCARRRPSTGPWSSSFRSSRTSTR